MHPHTQMQSTRSFRDWDARLAEGGGGGGQGHFLWNGKHPESGGALYRDSDAGFDPNAWRPESTKSKGSKGSKGSRGSRGSRGCRGSGITKKLAKMRQRLEEEAQAKSEERRGSGSGHGVLVLGTTAEVTAQSGSPVDGIQVA